MQCDDIRHHPDGGIDYAFYRAEARRMRAEAVRDLASRKTARNAVAIGALSLSAVGMAATAFQILTGRLPSGVASAEPTTAPR